VRADAERRNKNARRQQINHSRDGGALLDDADDDAAGDSQQLLAMEGGGVPSGSPLSTFDAATAFPFAAATASAATVAGGGSGGAGGSAYNPHKSFRLLVLRDLPWWRLLLPPWALSFAAHKRLASKAGTRE
jgi:hypothetical protein